LTDLESAGSLVVNLADRTVTQYPTMGVKTKNRKSAVTRLLEIADLLGVIEELDLFIRATLPDTAP
jgi:hypothetical protein